MINGARRLRELLSREGVLLCPGTFDCVSAKVAERAGFPVLSISGAALTASVLGYPDVGLTTMPEVLSQARNIARCVEVPVTVDADTGYGNALNAMRATREFEAAGLAGMMIEDQVFPKRCGHFEGKKIIPAEEMVIKVRAVCDARRNNDFVIIARTDARAVAGIDEAIRRALMYCEAGADMIFVESMMSVEEMRKVAKAIPRPLKANMNDGGKTPPVHYDELYAMGYKLINYSGMLQRTAIRAMTDVAEILKREGTTASAYPEKICDMTERSELLGLSQFYELEERLYGKFLETEGSWRKELDERSSARGAGTRKIPL
jgi:2,3-dimethylmalate lyase